MSAALPRRRLVICVLSAQRYEERRQACRETWFQEAAACPGVEIVFVVGGGPSLSKAVRTDDMLHLPCPDDYESLPQKVHQFFLWAVATYDFDFVFKCDDDTYVRVPRIMAYALGDRDYVGSDIGGYASGGAGYFVSQRAARKLATDLRGRRTGAEDLIVGEVLRRRGFVLGNTGLLAPFLAPTTFPSPDNHLITGHHIDPQGMRRIHAPFLLAPEPDPSGAFKVVDWETGWGVLGLRGALGHEVSGETRVVLPDIALDWDRYQLLSLHVDGRIEIEVDRPVGIFGFLEGHSWNTPGSPVSFAVDGRAAGVLVRPGERTPELRLGKGRHVLRMTTPGTKTRRYPVWAVRELPLESAVRIVIPTSNRYLRPLEGTLELLGRYWPGHPPVDVVHHEERPKNTVARTFFAGPQSEVSWCEAMAAYLSSQNTDELVLLLLDDYGLCQPVDTDRIETARALMQEDLSIGAFFLTWMQLPASTPYPGNDGVIVWPRWSYSVHTQAALWRRTSLLRAVRRAGRLSIGAFEIEGSRHFNEHEFAWEKHVSFRLPAPPVPSLFLDSCDKTHWPVAYNNLCNQGRPDARHEAFLRTQGLALG